MKKNFLKIAAFLGLIATVKQDVYADVYNYQSAPNFKDGITYDANPIFIPRKHPKQTPKMQQRAALKRKNIKKRKKH